MVNEVWVGDAFNKHGSHCGFRNGWTWHDTVHLGLSPSKFLEHTGLPCMLGTSVTF